MLGIIGIVLGCILLALALYVVATYNVLIRMKNRIEEALATMEAYLKKRYDLIPNLVETVKGYARHEKQTFSDVIEARNKVMSAVGFEEMSRSENTLKGTLKSLFALAENYPQLKADQSFLNLQEELSRVENDILQSRKYYNGVVKSFNTRTETFPSSMVASAFGMGKREYYRVEAEEQKNIKVSF
ncbi:MAG: LemA family protein [Clostridia bacterium]|nr:LemA family protein [Clostridia bacterium]